VEIKPLHILWNQFSSELTVICVDASQMIFFYLEAARVCICKHNAVRVKSVVTNLTYRIEVVLRQLSFESTVDNSPKFPHYELVERCPQIWIIRTRLSVFTFPNITVHAVSLSFSTNDVWVCVCVAYSRQDQHCSCMFPLLINRSANRCWTDGCVVGNPDGSATQRTSSLWIISFLV
jgi:hypothetical protein